MPLSSLEHTDLQQQWEKREALWVAAVSFSWASATCPKTEVGYSVLNNQRGGYFVHYTTDSLTPSALIYNNDNTSAMAIIHTRLYIL